MTDEVVAALSDITGAYSDSRTCYCRLDQIEAPGGGLVLTGQVLDEMTLQDAVGQLAARFPQITCDTTRVRVLRSGAPTRVLGTNITGFYARPSFLAEQLSQLLSGSPVEVLLEEDRWCFARQPDGYLGWVYAPYLSSASIDTVTHLVCSPETGVGTEPHDAAPLATRLLGGASVAVDGEDGPWRHVRLAGGQSGWVKASALRALDALPYNEKARRDQIIRDAEQFTGVQYLWGGCSAWGIDCSGFSQLLHRLSGVVLPRDADMQYAAGQPVDFPYQPGDLLFFGEAGDARKITHVAVSRGGWDIIHSSRRINGVYEDNVQQVERLRETFVGARTFLKD